MTGSDATPPEREDLARQDRRRLWRSWFAVHVLSVIAIGGALAVHQIAIDPFGIWGVQQIAGYNNLKSSQKVGRLTKTYQYARLRPEVVFLGDSRIGMGLPAEWPGSSADRVYNFGLDDLQMEEARETVDFMIRTHRPRVLVLGIDLLIFSRRPRRFPPDYSRERQEWVAFSTPTRLAWQLKETVFSFDALKRARTTVEESRKRPGTRLFSAGGYRQECGDRATADRNRYKHYVWNYLTNRYRKYRLRERSLKDFDGIVETAQRAGIELHVFWVPKSADMLAVVDLNGKWAAMERIKRHVAGVVPFWDFGMVSSVNLERNNFYDMSHFLGRVGAMVVTRMADPAAEVPPDFGVMVTAGNVEQRLEEGRRQLEAYQAANRPLMKSFKKALKKQPKKAAFLKEISPRLGFSAVKKAPRPVEERLLELEVDPAKTDPAGVPAP